MNVKVGDLVVMECGVPNCSSCGLAEVTAISEAFVYYVLLQNGYKSSAYQSSIKQIVYTASNEH